MAPGGGPPWGGLAPGGGIPPGGAPGGGFAPGGGTAPGGGLGGSVFCALAILAPSANTANSADFFTIMPSFRQGETLANDAYLGGRMSSSDERLT